MQRICAVSNGNFTLISSHRDCPLLLLPNTALPSFLSTRPFAYVSSPSSVKTPLANHFHTLHFSATNPTPAPPLLLPSIRQPIMLPDLSQKKISSPASPLILLLLHRSTIGTPSPPTLLTTPTTPRADPPLPPGLCADLLPTDLPMRALERRPGRLNRGAYVPTNAVSLASTDSVGGGSKRTCWTAAGDCC